MKNDFWSLMLPLLERGKWRKEARAYRLLIGDEGFGQLSSIQRVLLTLMCDGEIDDKTARECGTSRLSDAIFKLRRFTDITTKMVDGKNRYGQPVRYAVYYLEEASDD